VTERLARGAARGVVGAMAMTGMRSFTKSIGLLEESPPRSILRQRARVLFRASPKRGRRAVQEAMHWGYGAAGGAAFAALPEEARRQRWTGPLYGLVLWLGFELVQAPLMGLSQARELRPLDRLALAADHLLYGLVLSDARSPSRE
jgi:hypothetical protein